jgi:hypothetical protein
LEPTVTVGTTDPSPKFTPLIVITDEVEKGQLVTALLLEVQLVLVMLVTTGALNDKPMLVV